MKLGVPEGTKREHLADLPDGVEVEFVPSSGSISPAVGEVEFWVPSFDRQRMREVVPHLTRLKVIQALSAGVDSILPLVPDGVLLCDARGLHDGPVSEWIVAAILAMSKRFPTYRDLQRDGRWEPADVQNVQGQTVLIVGYGSIGRATEARLAPFGVQIVRVARHGHEGVHTLEDLDELLPRADAVVILVPLTPETEKLVDAAFLGRMKEGALLVNAARGRVTDTDALLNALQAGRIRAALDVTDPEPLPPGHPLWQAPGAFLTPHIAGWNPRFLTQAYRLVTEQVARYVRGEPLRNVVNEGY